MQGLKFLLFIGFLWGCHRPQKTPESASEPSALSADQKPSNKTCRAVKSPERLLSRTGCVDPNHPELPAAGVIPYDIVAPLWSDGSQKQRFLAVPEGRQAQISPSGHIDVPVGTVTIKVFLLDGKPIETRLFMKVSERGWRGYSYEWRADGSDAELLDDRKEKVIGDQTWVYPSQEQCDSCHNEVSEFSLGLTVMQLLPKLPDLAEAGILTYDQAALPEQKLVDYRDGSEPIEARARSYLQGNCAFCHQPQGGGIGTFDFRIQNDFFSLGICNQVPLIDVFPVADARIFKPGVPAESVLLLRMKDQGDYHMPPLISRVIDEDGVELMEKWILLRSSCEIQAYLVSFAGALND